MAYQPRIPEEERVRIETDLRNGMSLYAAGKKYGRSPGLMQKIAQEIGIDTSSRVPKAMAATLQAKYDANRTALKLRLLERLEGVLDMMGNPEVTDIEVDINALMRDEDDPFISGEDGSDKVLSIKKPAPKSKTSTPKMKYQAEAMKNLAIAVGVLHDKLTREEEKNGKKGDEDAYSHESARAEVLAKMDELAERRNKKDEQQRQAVGE